MLWSPNPSDVTSIHPGQLEHNEEHNKLSGMALVGSWSCLHINIHYSAPFSHIPCTLNSIGELKQPALDWSHQNAAQIPSFAAFGVIWCCCHHLGSKVWRQCHIRLAIWSHGRGMFGFLSCSIGSNLRCRKSTTVPKEASMPNWSATERSRGAQSSLHHWRPGLVLGAHRCPWRISLTHCQLPFQPQWMWRALAQPGWLMRVSGELMSVLRSILAHSTWKALTKAPSPHPSFLPAGRFWPLLRLPQRVLRTTGCNMSLFLLPKKRLLIPRTSSRWPLMAR